MSLIVITVLSAIFRWYGALQNYPFWVDEFSTGNQGRYLLAIIHGHAPPSTILFESNNFLSHLLVTFSFLINGESETAARLPFLIAGTFVPVSIYLVTKKNAGAKIAFSAALFGITSYFLIAWSRQARGYVLLQNFILLFLYFFSVWKKKKSFISFFVLLIITICGLLTHIFFSLFIFTVLIVHIQEYKLFMKNKMNIALTTVLTAGIFGILLKIGLLNDLILSFRNGYLNFHNNLAYYHSFLWREYGLLVFLSIIGILASNITNNKTYRIMTVYIIIHLIFISFFFGHRISKYILPIFPLILIFAAMGVSIVSEALHIRMNKKNNFPFVIPHGILVLFFTLFIIGNGHKFVIKPKKYYSVNHDFREIANIDYHQVYSIIKSKTEKTAVIDPWHERAFWYLGTDFPDYFSIRWTPSADVNKRTIYKINKDEFNMLNDARDIRVVRNIVDLQKVIHKYETGFIFIDDDTLPSDVIEYAKEHFHKELFLDHYPLDDNPYSRWPATLYSWGFTNSE